MMTQPLADNYQFWTPHEGQAVKVGPEQAEVPLPQLRLPIKTEFLEAETLSDDMIGTSLYDYLRQFPDCPSNREYAEILRDAFPHYLADLASQIVMLDHKDVEAPYVKRKLASLQILLLLQPDNRGLLLQLGIGYYDLGLMFPELPDCRTHFARAMHFLAGVGDDAAALNCLARIDFLLGDYPKAIARWQRVMALVDDPATKNAIADQVARLSGEGEPERPLIDGLEAIGTAMQLMAAGDHAQARGVLEAVEEENIIPVQFPNPEFYYMLGICREKTGDPAGAFQSFSDALTLDEGHEPSREALDRVTGGNS